MTKKKCPECNGKGKRELTIKETDKKITVTCELCNGHGEIRVPTRIKRS